MSTLFYKIINRLSFSFNNLYKPQIKSGYRRKDGVFLKKTRISNTTYIENKSNLYIEDNVFIGHFNFIDASHGLIIEEGCQITNFVSILTHSSHNSIRLYGKHYLGKNDLVGYVKGPVYIGKYTFIGPHSVILPKTHIGKGSVVSAYSFVKGVFQDFSLIAGNPAQVVGSTRDVDDYFLSLHPELIPYYKAWTEND